MEQAEKNYHITFKKEKKPWYLTSLLPVYFIVSTVYLFFLFTLLSQWDYWFIPIIIFAEIYRLFFTITSLLCMRTIQFANFQNPQYTYTVDVLIPTLNEPIEIVEPTVRGALSVRGINKVFVLDDGNRPFIKEMAVSLGAEYGARRSSAHAKAGNMNFGLQLSKADFIITLDADHIPNSEFIERTIGYFNDTQLAFIQTPQSFYNTNSIQHRDVKDYPTWNEQTMFYDAIQPAKNAYNAAFFCGSSAILRRKAIDSVGGFATGTATEDIHTSIRIHSKGWKSLFVNEKLAFGLAADDLKEYHKQRVRWGAGSLGLLLRTKDSPLIIKNLTVMQRLGYINSTLAYAQGYFKLFYYLLPIYIIFSPIQYIDSRAISYLVLYIPFLLATFWITKLYSRNTYHPLYTEQYNIANIFANIQAIKGVWKIEKKFPVSIKIKKAKEISMVFYILIAVAVLMICAELFGIVLFMTDVSVHFSERIQSSLFIGLFWNTMNLIMYSTFLYFLYTFNFKESTLLLNKSEVVGASI
ncbi:MAG TPA: glycosyltransferase [Candidatus Woesebacteria bacterium]|nr:glycosyltransferase [Candidatus Woesebacteria bacterium]